MRIFGTAKTAEDNVEISNPIRQCPCCGATKFESRKVLWKALIQEWMLSSAEVAYIDRQQGLFCTACKSNLRSMALALAVCRAFNFDGTLQAFVATEAAAHLKILEVNDAGDLTKFFTGLPGHVIAKYPEIDMMAMAYPEGSFDLVIHSDTLEHIPHPVTALSECNRVLKVGGACAFTVPIIVGRMTRNRAGLPPSYHGNSGLRAADWAVQTEYGCDVWTQVFEAGFSDCRLVSPEFPSAVAIVAKH